MPIGKLHSFKGEEFEININKFFDEPASDWWGEFTLTEYRKVGDGDRYVIELEDGRKGKCTIKRRVNMATFSVPPLYRYHFRGNGLLE